MNENVCVEQLVLSQAADHPGTYRMVRQMGHETEIPRLTVFDCLTSSTKTGK